MSFVVWRKDFRTSFEVIMIHAKRTMPLSAENSEMAVKNRNYENVLFKFFLYFLKKKHIGMAENCHLKKNSYGHDRELPFEKKSYLHGRELPLEKKFIPAWPRTAIRKKIGTHSAYMRLR